MDDKELVFLPYIAASISVTGRFMFMFILYKNKSTNGYSLLFCTINICSSSLWLYYNIIKSNMPMIIRSIIEIIVSTISCIYIIKNKIVFLRNTHQIFLT